MAVKPQTPRKHMPSKVAVLFCHEIAGHPIYNSANGYQQILVHQRLQLDVDLLQRRGGDSVDPSHGQINLRGEAGHHRGELLKCAKLFKLFQCAICEETVIRICTRVGIVGHRKEITLLTKSILEVFALEGLHRKQLLLQVNKAIGSITGILLCAAASHFLGTAAVRLQGAIIAEIGHKGVNAIEGAISTRSRRDQVISQSFFSQHSCVV
mmetsp:Transcript_25153/g.54789  ORF Transcript_25153/g.54789 Transcript_25153/m.54789 type:complete len:210 (+) Transcript_25153:281-910(+)